MKIELSESELIFIRSAAREYRTAAPEHIVNDWQKLARWVDERSLNDEARMSVDRKMTDALVTLFDERHKLRLTN